jgi:orotate phosphoribosyltransferase-like protein
MDLKENRKRWKKFINDQSTSNKTIVQYCKDNDLSVHQFHYYKKKFKKENEETRNSNFVKVIQPEVIIDDQISMTLNGIEVTMNHPNLIKLLKTVKQLD